MNDSSDVTGPVSILTGDNREVLRSFADASFDAVVTDPPYGLRFMGAAWDYDVPGVGVWREVFRVMRPGAYLVAFFGTRTYHRGAVAVEDAGFEVRDTLMWLYGTGFPKGAGCLKPAWEPILLCRKPGPKVLPLGIDGCRIPSEPWKKKDGGADAGFKSGKFMGGAGRGEPTQTTGTRSNGSGRWPANVLHDGSDEVLEAFAAFGERPSGSRKAGSYQPLGMYGNAIGDRPAGMERDMPALKASTGTAARFFYCAKASKADRGAGNTHPTVKPLALMRWLVRLISRPGDRVLDPYTGSGTTLVAAAAENRHAVGIELDPAFAEMPGTLFEAGA
jgi:hypothetical protein